MTTRPDAFTDADTGNIDMEAVNREYSRTRFAVGIIAFAAILMIAVGGIHVIAGFSEILADDLIVIPRAYAYDFDPAVWGWFHLVTGALFVLVGAGLFTGALIARIAGVIVAIISMVINFMFLPIYPFWAVLMITIDALLIWALTTRGWAMLEENRRI